MDYSNRRWVIVNVSDITDEMIVSAIQSSMATLRKTLDGSKAILKFEGNTPNCFEGLTTYNHSEILTELAKSAWTSSEE
jgi:hypothetical protein|tara:strand:+ start:1908 stop:2144 length:237 start_codon:yes stop_codon:yes gene_type:complete